MRLSFVRLAAAAAGLLAAGAAQAETWWFVSHNDEQVMLIDADSISDAGANRTATVRMYPIRSGGPGIAGARIEADCAGNRVRYLHIAGYSPSLRVTAEGPPPDGFREWRQLRPSNNGALAVRFACGEREAEDWVALRIGSLGARAGDPPLLATLVRDGVSPPLAAFFALGSLPRDQADALLRAAPEGEAATLRRHGFPR